MPFPILAFQVFNLNDYDVKLFPIFDENKLYISRIIIQDKYPEEEIDSGSSQRTGKIIFTSSGSDSSTLKHFPFTALFKSEVVSLKVKTTSLTQYVALHDTEYNYILILYPSSSESQNGIDDYLQKLGVESEQIDSFESFIQSKIDELDEKLFKQSRGTARLQRKINPKASKETQLLNEHIKILSEDPELGNAYIKLINEFDNEFLHSQEDKFEYDSTTRQKIVD